MLHSGAFGPPYEGSVRLLYGLVRGVSGFAAGFIYSFSLYMVCQCFGSPSNGKSSKELFYPVGFGFRSVGSVSRVSG